MSSRRYAVSSSEPPIGNPQTVANQPKARSSFWRNVLALILTFGTPAMLVGSLPGLTRGGEDYLLMPRAELLGLPTTGGAWDSLKATADADWGAPDLCDQDVKHGALALAGALVFARTGDTTYATKTRAAIRSAMGTEQSTCAVLSIGRQLGGYVLAADFIKLGGSDDDAFRSWLAAMRTRTFTDHSRWQTIVGTHQDSPNNWGAFAGASRIAASLYLGDTADVAQAAAVLRGFLGDRSAWDHFRGQGDTNPILADTVRAWACDPSADGFIPVNAACTLAGINLDGGIVNDVSRDGLGLIWPVGPTGIGYTLESLQGLVLQAELLYRNGYPGAWGWSNNALERAARLVTRNGAAGGTAWNTSSVNHYVPWLLNYRYGLKLPTMTAVRGRIFGYTDWLYGQRNDGGSSTPAPTSPPPNPTPNPTAGPAPTPTPVATPTPTPTSPPAVTRPELLFASSAATGGTGLKLTRTASTSAGDVLIAVIDVKASKGTKLSAPTGWTLVRQDGYRGSLTTSIFVRTATASEAGTYTFATSRAAPTNGMLLGVRGLNAANPVADSSALAGSGTRIVAPSVSVARNGELLVAMFAVASYTNVTPPSGMAQWIDINQASLTGLTSAVALQTVAAGPSGDRIAVAGVPGDNIGHLVLLRPS